MLLQADDFANHAGGGDDIVIFIAQLHMLGQLADAAGLEHLLLAGGANADAAFGHAVGIAHADMRPQRHGALDRIMG